MLPRDSFTHTVLECGVGMSFEKNGFLVLDSLSEVVEGSGAVEGGGAFEGGGAVEGGGAFRRMR